MGQLQQPLLTLQIVVFTTAITTTATAATTTTGFSGVSSNKRHNIKAYAKMYFRLHFFQISVVNGDYCIFSVSDRFIPKESGPVNSF
jgi:hypothetical protein